jgi:hypothetical protein
MKKLAIAALAAGTIFGSTSASAMQASNAAQAGTSWQAQAPVQLAMKGGHGGGHHGGYKGGHRGGHKGGHKGGFKGGHHRGKHRGSFHGGFGRSFGWGWGGGWGGGGGNWWVSVQAPPPMYYHPCYGWYGGYASTGAWSGEWRDGTYHGSYTPAGRRYDGAPPPGHPGGSPMSPAPHGEDAPLPPHHDMPGGPMPQGDHDVAAPPMTWHGDGPPPPAVHGKPDRYAGPYGWCGGYTETVTTTTTTGGCCEKEMVKVYEKPAKVRRRVKAKHIAVAEK